MNKRVRLGVFETNSSSTHSISISLGDFIPDRLGNKIFPGEFGWEEEEYKDAATKASYCLTYAKQRIVTKWVDGKEIIVDTTNSDKHLQMLREVIEAEIKSPVEFVQSSFNDYHPWGYIDHQSDGVCSEAFENKETLRAFIFNTNSILWTDNDNH